MKKRHRSRRQRTNSQGGGWRNSFSKPTRRDRRAWIFEHLEERYYFSATPVAGLAGLQWSSVSNSTAEGQQLIDALEQLWALEASASNPSGVVDAAIRSAPTDPAFQYQWHLFNVGQAVTFNQFQDIFGKPGEDINVIPAWDSGITGKGVKVAVVDTGVELTHPDLAANISFQYAYNALSPGANVTPSGNGPDAAHGTAVAGLIGAVANNGIGGVGVAYGSTIIPIKLIPSGFSAVPLTSQAIVRAVLANGAPVDIYNHSWGPVDAGQIGGNRGVDALTREELIAFTNSARLGRNGLGAIHVFAAGNGALDYDSAGSDGYVNSRYTIGVGIVDHDGQYLNSDGTSTGYGEMAPSVLVVAPSASGPTDIINNFDTGSGIFTTDLTGAGLINQFAGYNSNAAPGGQDPDTDAYPDDDYTSRFGGTSAAAPQVSGVIALMLEANPNLTYRDVEEILVRSARQNDDLDPSWVVNNVALFRDPIPPRFINIDGELFYEVGDGILYKILPGEDPTAVPDDNSPMNDYDFNFLGYNPIYNPRLQPMPIAQMTNGAGYTVSYGRRHEDATEYGYAHGVVDAALAVDLARQWHLKNQNLPSEKTWIAGAVGSVTIRHAEVTNDDSGKFLIPGGLSNATDGFAEFFNEFFKEPTVTAGDSEADPPTEDMIDPDSLPFGGDDPPANTRGTFVGIDVPAIDVVTGGSNLMSVEWVEVKLNITGDAGAMNNLRIVLVSPDGTHSEFTQNQYRPGDIDKSFQYGTLPVNLFVGVGDSITPVDENGTNTDTLDWVYSTNRIWGERSDSDPLTGRGWQLYFENYSGSDLSLNGVTIAFHGSPLGSSAGPVERIMGKIGVDGGRYVQLTDETVGAQDGEFNFDRRVPIDPLADDYLEQLLLFPSGYRTDPYQEEFASNVTVYAIDNATGQRVAQFVTGADGNYYFDLPAGEYTIGIEDPLGRTALDGGAGKNYDKQWVVKVDTSDILTRTAGLTHIETIDTPDGPVDFEVVDQVYNNLNFLLDPGSLPVNQVVFSGQVIADLDGNGIQDPRDTGVFNFLVFADLNHTGKFEIGEPFTYTDVNGNFTLPVSTATPNTFTIGVVKPLNWTASFPFSGFQTEYARPGDVVDNIKFLVKSPATPTNDGNGYIFGLVFSDKNGDGVQGSNEPGLAGRVVFIDANHNGTLDDGEISTITSATGAYQFGEVPPGTVQLDIVVAEPFVLTSPVAGFRTVTLVAGQVSKGNDFAIRNLAVSDFGDLNGAGYRTNDAASVVTPGVSLGNSVDAEIRPRNLMIDPNSDPLHPTYIVDPTKNGIGDDQANSSDDFDDEDGVVLVGGVLRPGANTVSVTVKGVGFYLQGWFDFNNDGDFDDAGEQVFTNLDINPGTYQFLVTAPQSLADGTVAARFRWGHLNQTYFSTDSAGEIEDYIFDSAAAPIVLPPGDFNGDQLVTIEDYQLWKATFGSTVDLRADANKNGVIDAADYTIWLAAFLNGGGGGAAAQSVAESSVADEPSHALTTYVAPTIDANTLQAMINSLRFQPTAPLSPAAMARLQQLGAVASVVNGVTRYSVDLGASNLGTTPPAVAAPAFSTGGSAAVVESAEPVASTANALDLSFTTNVGHSVAASNFHHRDQRAESNADMALLLLAHGVRHESSTSDDDAFDSDAQWLCKHEEQDGEMDLALAAAFEHETNWRLAM